MPVIRRIIISLLLSLFLLCHVNADILKLPNQQPVVLQLPDEPMRGTTKDQVASKYGEPLTRRPAVGDPPISSWEYEGYTVYFEGVYVLHSVVKSSEAERVTAN